MPGLVVKQKKMKRDYWPTYIYNRVTKYNKNFLGFFSGPTGSGKSWSSLEAARESDAHDEFSVDRCYFSIKDLIKDCKDKKLRKGNAAVVEEVGILANTRKWQNVENTALNFLTQAFRKERFIVFFNAPSWMFFDSATRKLLHGLFKTVSIDFKNKCCIVKPFMLQYNDLYDKLYRKYLRVATPSGVAPLERWAIKSPPKDMIAAYEDKKTAFLDKLYKDLGHLLDPKEKKKKEHKHSWTYKPGTVEWWCRACGFKTSINPFINKEEGKTTNSTPLPRKTSLGGNMANSHDLGPLFNSTHREETKP